MGDSTEAPASAQHTGKTDDFALRVGVVRHLMQSGIARSNIRHEITLDTSSSGGRCDMLVLRENALLGIELKSGKDNLDRCESQALQYRSCFDQYVMVADRKHVTSRDQFGICGWSAVIFESGELHHIYGGRVGLLHGYTVKTSFHVSAYRMMLLLWRNEAVAVAARCGISAAVRHRAVEQVAQHIPLKQIRSEVARELRVRVPSRWEDAFWKRFDALPEIVAA